MIKFAIDKILVKPLFLISIETGPNNLIDCGSFSSFFNNKTPFFLNFIFKFDNLALFIFFFTINDL